MTYALSSTFGLSLVPWYEQIQIGQGTPVRLTFNGGQPTNEAIYEPASTTHIYGALLSARVSF